MGRPLMKTRVVSIVATLFLLAPAVANSTVIYELTGFDYWAHFSFRFESADFIAGNTIVPAADLLSCTASSGWSCAQIEFDLTESSTTELIRFLETQGSQTFVTSFYFAEGAFGSLGTYGDFFGRPATLTVTSGGTSVPEPSALALFGIGLSGLFFARRGKRN